MKIEYEIDLEGYEFVGYRTPMDGEEYYYDGGVVTSGGFNSSPLIIVRKIPPPPPKEIWVNEYPDNEPSVTRFHHLTKDMALRSSGFSAIRRAVRYIEAPKESE